MLSNQENFSAASKDPNLVSVRVLLCQHPDVFFSSIDFVETFFGDKFINKNNLSTILDHAVTSKACEGENYLLRHILEQAVQLGAYCNTFFHSWFHENFQFGVFKSVLSCQHLENISVIFDGFQIAIKLPVTFFEAFLQLLYLMKQSGSDKKCLFGSWVDGFLKIGVLLV